MSDITRVRAKFTYTGYSASLTNIFNEKTPEGKPDYTKPTRAELRTLKFNPVFGNGDPEHENTKFWQSSPSGELTLGCLNPAAWSLFVIGKEYYLDFTEAP